MPNLLDEITDNESETVPGPLLGVDRLVAQGQRPSVPPGQIGPTDRRPSPREAEPHPGADEKGRTPRRTRSWHAAPPRTPAPPLSPPSTPQLPREARTSRVDRPGPRVAANSVPQAPLQIRPPWPRRASPSRAPRRQQRRDHPGDPADQHRRHQLRPRQRGQHQIVDAEHRGRTGQPEGKPEHHSEHRRDHRHADRFS